MMSEKRFKSPIENALRGCQFGVKLGKNRGYPYWILTPNERLLCFGIRTSVPNFIKIGSKLRPWEHGQWHTHRHIHTQRDHTSDLIICPMLCYSNGTDNNVHECDVYNAPQFITEFPDKGWTYNSISRQLVKLRKFGTVWRLIFATSCDAI